MITVTNNSLDFYEKDRDLEILIYSAGNTGMWTGYFMNRVGIDYSCYLDSDVKKEGALLNGKPIFRPDKLKDYQGRSIKIVVCPTCYKEICSDLLWLDKKYGFHALCLVPQYKDFIHNDERYNINKFLGYFRRKLVQGDVPTFISNDCTSGFLYEALGMIMLSPVINVGIKGKDYIKLCKNPQYYLNKDLSEIWWERIYNDKLVAREVPVAKLDDISLFFSHLESEEGIQERWSIMKKRINWNRIIFIMQDAPELISADVLDEFECLQNKHLFVSTKSHDARASNNIVYMNNNWLQSRNSVIENYFDLVGWLNQE